MNFFLELAVMGSVCLILEYSIRPYHLRKWGGILIAAAGLVSTFMAPAFVNGIDIGAVPFALVFSGISVFSNRRKYEKDRDSV